MLTKFFLFGLIKEYTHNKNPVNKNKVVSLGISKGAEPKNIL